MRKLALFILPILLLSSFASAQTIEERAPNDFFATIKAWFQFTFTNNPDTKLDVLLSEEMRLKNELSAQQALRDSVLIEADSSRLRRSAKIEKLEARLNKIENNKKNIIPDDEIQSEPLGDPRTPTQDAINDFSQQFKNIYNQN